ncbi:Pectinesterase inhibitor, putative [Ricinus communis]|uniref:Pectinesterase inhibitor, putative n=1 Tax=Ricinus communis TaxID=3988 RepID=B9SAU2_RICCO|nr:Pectinesterase inhibitor, putative [Ricinus communis]|eukprot:XP_002523111.1 pectinesterase inhibitor 10 [Ricinus communis]
MKPATSFFFLFSLVVSLFPHPNFAASLVEQVCERTHSKDNCVASFGSSPDSKQANLQQLGIIALKLASENATDTSLQIKKLLSDKSLGPATEQALTDCYDQYVDANAQLADSVAALLANASRDVYTWVSAAIASAQSCEDGLKQSGGQDSVLKQRNAMFRQLCNNVLAINKLLVKQSGR